MSISAITFDTPHPNRFGNTGYGMICGVFTDSAVSYVNALAAVAGYFQTSPTPRILYLANGGVNTYTFMAMGRVV